MGREAHKDACSGWAHVDVGGLVLLEGVDITDQVDAMNKGERGSKN